MASPELRANLGLKLGDRGGRKTLTPRPASPPTVLVERAVGRTVFVRLRDRDSIGRGRARGAKGVNVYRFVGSRPPSDLRDWKFVKETVDTRFGVDFDGDLPPGTQVWVSAQWKNARGRAGPGAAGVTCNLPCDATGMRISGARVSA